MCLGWFLGWVNLALVPACNSTNPYTIAGVKSAVALRALPGFLYHLQRLQRRARARALARPSLALAFALLRSVRLRALWRALPCTFQFWLRFCSTCPGSFNAALAARATLPRFA